MSKAEKPQRSHVILSDEYVEAVQDIQCALRAKSAMEIVRRSIRLLKFVHESQLKFYRISSDSQAKPIKINHPDYFPQSNSKNNLTLDFDAELNTEIRSLIDDEVAKNKTEIVRRGIGLMAQFYDAHQNTEILVANYEGKRREWHNLAFISKKTEISFKVPVSPVGVLMTF